MRCILLFISFLFMSIAVQGQSPMMSRHSRLYYDTHRALSLRFFDSLPAELDPYFAHNGHALLQSLWSDSESSQVSQYNLNAHYKEYVEFLPSKPIITTSDDAFQPEIKEIYPNKSSFNRRPSLKYFYKNQGSFFKVDKNNFSLSLDPIIHFRYENQVNNPNTIFTNTRGVELRSQIDKKVYVYAQLLENQRSFYNYIDERILKFNSIPGQGTFKLYSSSIINDVRGYDYFTATSYVGFRPTKSINLELGHGSHHLGNGIRSLLLSDYAPNKFYLSLDWTLWKFRYKNIFSELQSTTFSQTGQDDALPKKFNASHYLEFQPSRKFSIGIFETVIFSRDKQFELQYLNPVILYRAIEFRLGSPDNVILGLNSRWNVLKGINLYGQIIIDEFLLKEVSNANGWWANKFGAQLGLEYFDVAKIDHLDLKMEYNAVRPYTYSHRESKATDRPFTLTSYSHANLPLAHPLGANFREVLLQVRYQPIPRLTISSRATYAESGLDPSGKNFGGNILLDFQTRESEYDNFIGQGTKSKIYHGALDLSYELFHDCFLDLNAVFRRNTLPDQILTQHVLGTGLRLNLANVSIDY
jgi:hypothetical protein